MLTSLHYVYKRNGPTEFVLLQKTNQDREREKDKPSVNMFDFVLSNVLCVVNIPTEMNLARRFVSCLVRLRFIPWPVALKQLTDFSMLPKLYT